MNNNEENIKNKITLNNPFPKAENETNPSDIPPQSGKQNVPIQDVKLKVKPLKSASDIANKKDVLSQISKSNEQVPSTSNFPAGQGGAAPLLNFVDTQKEKTQKIVFKKAAVTRPVINLNEINMKPENSLKPEELSVNQEEEKNKAYFTNFEVLSSTDNEKKHISDTVKLHLKPETASSSAFSTLASEEKPEGNTPVEENNGKTCDSIGSITDSTTKFAKKNIKYLYIVGALIIIIILLYFLISTIKTLMII